MLKENQRYTLKCEETNNFGNAVCRIDGMVVFVCGAVSGDIVEVEIQKITSSYAVANVTKIISPSPHRIAPECSAFGECGGCAFLNVSIEKENEIKGSYVKSTLAKFGISAEVEGTVCPKREAYRNKVVLFNEKGRLGYVKSASNRVVPHNRCPLNEKIIDDIAKFTVSELDTTYLRALFIRKASSENGGIMVCPIFRKQIDIKHYARKLRGEFPRVESVLSGVCAGRDFIIEACQFKHVLGEEGIIDELCGLEFFISPKSFYQVNHDCAELMYERVISLLDADERKNIADLFCGTGTIGLIVAKRTGAYVYGVEIEPEAVKDAKNNAELNEITNIEFFEGDAKNFDRSIDACIIDPPRKGCSDLMIETLLRLSPEKIVYVSCNPDTLARDLKKLTKKYDISSPVTPYNMFPRTSHIESVVCLTRQANEKG
ncbi:MAG: 23S rRNA (uracil(1939)-C(5))-methyltransferase RlmD [Clostridia bacterium]|nr:23S rRNA (uracil(1939)-C(5))-methyltransferase RlmD [Clostridia bacterium]